MPEITKFFEDGSIIIKSEEGVFAHKPYYFPVPIVVDKSEGEKLFSQAREMFVFRMDDHTWIAHFSEEEALEYYHEMTGVPLSELQENFDDWGLVPLSDTMFWDSKDISDLESKMKEIVYVGDNYHGNCYEVTFNWVLQNRSAKYPGFIACTEA